MVSDARQIALRDNEFSFEGMAPDKKAQVIAEAQRAVDSYDRDFDKVGSDAYITHQRTDAYNHYRAILNAAAAEEKGSTGATNTVPPGETV
jgi:hypothetical protein